MDYAVSDIYQRIKHPVQSVSVPGSKSITARALLLAALADGSSVLHGAQMSDDCATFLRAVGSLGIKARVQGDSVTVEGCGGVLPADRAEVYVGSAGTAARFITALCALSDGEFLLTSSEQMMRRPQRPLIEALTALGAQFSFMGEEYCFPFRVRGTSSPAPSVTVDITRSSQFLSALLMAAACARIPVKIKTVGSHGMDYVNMTLAMMTDFGVNVRRGEGGYIAEGRYAARSYDIEPDISAACYFYAMNRLLGTKISVNGVSGRTMQGDYKFIKLLENFDGGVADLSQFSDQTLTLAAIAPFFSSPTEIVGVKHIRGQECDRIRAISTNLALLGVPCEEREDGVKIYPATPHGGRVKTFGDHRVAMSFALTGLRCGGVVIEDAEVCAKTFKEYFSVLDDLVARLT